MKVLLCCLEWPSSDASSSLPGERNDSLPSLEIVRSGSHRLAHDGAELIETAGNPLVYGELPVPQANRTLFIWAHYDGQPVDPKGWSQPSPFRPVLRAGRLEDGARVVSNIRRTDTFDPEWRLYGRSASDDKALLAALDALKAAGVSPTSNIRVLLDGELELGSPSLPAAIRERWPGASERAADRNVWRPGWAGSDSLRAEGRRPQRPLRQLGAQSGGTARAPAGLDERRRGQSARRGVLRRHRAAHPRRTGPAQGRARRCPDDYSRSRHRDDRRSSGVGDAGRPDGGEYSGAHPSTGLPRGRVRAR